MGRGQHLLREGRFWRRACLLGDASSQKRGGHDCVFYQSLIGCPYNHWTEPWLTNHQGGNSCLEHRGSVREAKNWPASTLGSAAGLPGQSTFCEQGRNYVKKTFLWKKSDDDGSDTDEEVGLPSQSTLCEPGRPMHYQARAMSSALCMNKLRWWWWWRGCWG